MSHASREHGPFTLARVLIVVSDPAHRDSIDTLLRSVGYRTERAHDGRQGLELWRAARPDLVLLERDLPAVDGLEVARQIRTVSDVPIVVVTRGLRDSDEVEALDIGADDVVVESIGARSLLARIAGHLRRARLSRHAEQNDVRAGPLVVDTNRREIRVAGAPLAVTPAEFRLLVLMARTPGRAIPRRELLAATSPDGDALERSVDVHVKIVRRKLAACGRSVTIATVRGVGYALAIDV